MESDTIDFTELKNHLLEEDAFVTSLINTIPPKMYFDQEIQEQLTAEKHTAMDTFAAGMKRKFPKQGDMSAKSKHKRARLDPQHHKLVTEVQLELSQKYRKRPGVTVANVDRADNIDEIKDRLHSRMEKLRGKRKEPAQSDIPKKVRLAEKRKEKRRRMRQKKAGNTVKAVKKEPADNPPKPEVKSKAEPVYNKEKKLMYSKLEFTEDGEESTDKQKRRKKKSKTLKKLLHEAESEKEKIETIKKEDKSKAHSMAEKNAWRKAIQKAQGVKVKDDPELLKKSLKKQEKIKKKHSSAWKARVEHTEKLKKARQDKRAKNIKARKQDKRDKKIKRAKKKGRILSGL